MGSSVDKKFCDFASKKKILFLRITTRGDPVPGLPPKLGFVHPCSDDSSMRMEISEDCNSQLTMRPTPNVNYDGELDCQNYKTRAYIPNPLSHTIYLDIVYTNSVDIVKFLKGIGTHQEVLRGPDGSTFCRLIMGESEKYNAIFFDVNKAREKPSNTDVLIDGALDGDALNREIELKGGKLFSSFKIGGEVAEDRRMTKEAFDKLIQNMVKLQQGNLCPQKGDLINPFNDKIMPDLSCPGVMFGGKKYRRKLKTKKHKKTKKRHSRRH